MPSSPDKGVPVFRFSVEPPADEDAHLSNQRKIQKKREFLRSQEEIGRKPIIVPKNRSGGPALYSPGSGRTYGARQTQHLLLITGKIVPRPDLNTGISSQMKETYSPHTELYLSGLTGKKDKIDKEHDLLAGLRPQDHIDDSPWDRHRRRGKNVRAQQEIRKTDAERRLSKT